MRSHWQIGENDQDEDEEDGDEEGLLSLLSWRPSRRFTIGLDLGQLQDYTAVAVVQRSADRNGVVQVSHLERFPLGTPYHAIANRMERLLATPPLREQASLVVDISGVGTAVLDPLIQAKLSPIAITIAAATR